MTKHQFEGGNLIASNWSSKGSQKIYSSDPSKGSKLEFGFTEACPEEIDLACFEAELAFKNQKFRDFNLRSKFLFTLADEIEFLGGDLVEAACIETGLPSGRILGEKGRTVFQIREFAKGIEQGDFLGLSIDNKIPNREPIPKPDIRKMNIPIGPVAVFSAGNFPLAFSTAGGDTASAFAAGCPVVLKGHEGHLMTNEIIANAIKTAIKKSDLPGGVFSFVNGGYDIGKQLVQHPKIKSVAFTGSFQGGKALMDYSRKRKSPIPVFCEMGSINPILVSPISQENNSELAKNLADSVFQGTGQFCTNPGLLLIGKGAKTNSFLNDLGEQLQSNEPAPMLSKKIFESFSEKLHQLTQQKPVGEHSTSGYFKVIESNEFIENPIYSEEVFGPFTLAVVYDSLSDLNLVLEKSGRAINRIGFSG